jgi:predicted AAA+ superfamily ATPase
MLNRALRPALTARFASKLGRLLVLTGARQTGKTTLVRAAFPAIPYVSVEDPLLRPAFTGMSAADWIERYPRAVIDEVQKAPAIIESIKAAHDAEPRTRYVLLGSSQILLLSRVKESLAGRASIAELWPLTLPEMATRSWEEPVADSRLIAWLRGDPRDDGVLRGVPLADREHTRNRDLLDRYLRFGGMPVVLDPELSDDERARWLRDYQRTYLERDVADLAALRELEPFVLATRVAAEKTARELNFADLARAAGIAPTTARRFVRYLELSYQVLLLRPYFRNREKRLAKMPVLHFLDPGILRAVLNRGGDPSGPEIESAVVAEIFKQLRNAELRIELHHLRTYDGREVDLLLEREDGFVAVEIKAARHTAAADARAFAGLAELLDKPLLGALVLSLDPQVRRLAQGVLAVPIAWALGPCR